MCKRFSDYVRQDKRLWAECLRRDVISKAIELPKYRPSLEQASAENVRDWVSVAVSLHRAYATGGRLATVQSSITKEEFETTWVKIVRGRWCLVAMSNIFESSVGIWQIQPTGPSKLENKFYFPGPVIDGVVDDSTEEIRIAITVATT